MFLNFILALLPIIWLFIAFLALKLPGWIGCLIALGISIVESIIFKTTAFSSTLQGLTVGESVTASLEGFIAAIWPIGIIILAAMFTYNLCIETRAMDLIKKMLTSVTNDKRVLVLILAWGFGGFMEAVAGFGTAVAIPAAMMVALGFNPLFSAVACLVANAAPPTFGSIGIPTTTAASLTNIDPLVLSGPAFNMLIIPAFLSPFIIVALTGKSAGAKNAFDSMIGFTVIAGISYVIPAYIAAHYIGAEMVDLIGCTVSLVVMVLVAMKRKPTTDEAFVMEMSEEEQSDLSGIRFGYVTAWLPYILMLVLLIGTSKLFPAINGSLSGLKTVITVFSGPNPAKVTLAWVGNAAVMIIIAGIIGGFAQRASVSTMGHVLVKTCKGMWRAIATILFIVAMAKVMGYSGMTSSIATLLANLTGSAYPALAPLVGIIGTFVTGSTTSSGIIFAHMQLEVANLLGADPVQLVAANMAGGAIGKLISPQSIAVAIAAISTTDVVVTDGQIMAKTIKYCIFFGAIVCFLSYLFAVVL